MSIMLFIEGLLGQLGASLDWFTSYKLITWSQYQTNGYQIFKYIGIIWVLVKSTDT